MPVPLVGEPCAPVSLGGGAGPAGGEAGLSGSGAGTGSLMSRQVLAAVDVPDYRELSLIRESAIARPLEGSQNAKQS